MHEVLIEVKDKSLRNKKNNKNFKWNFDKTATLNLKRT